MADKDQELRLGFGLGLGLNLSLGLGLNLTPPTPPFPDVHSRSPWNHHLASSEQKTMTSIDVNQSPATGSHRDQSEEEAGTSSPNSTVSSASAKRDLSDEEDGDGSRKKLRLSKEQSLILEESFKEHSTLNPKQKVTLAKQLNLRPRQVEVWFQNRRARTKLKQTEVECELLKRCCDNLREENRRIQKEVQELRALKLSPQLYMHMTPPTTLTMCPSCERLSSNPSASAVSATSAQRHPAAAAAAAAAVAPWAPIPMRATSFIGAQRS